jgi:hypothetical protein
MNLYSSIGSFWEKGKVKLKNGLTNNPDPEKTPKNYGSTTLSNSKVEQLKRLLASGKW